MSELSRQIEDALSEALSEAERQFQVCGPIRHDISTELMTSLCALSDNGQIASTILTCIFTCLAIKVSHPNVDVRYHQVQIQHKTPRPAGFNFRGISENVIYPWLVRNHFEGAKSGWQTRTVERPKPFILSYDENIARVKVQFLTVFDRIECHNESAAAALNYLTLLQIVKRERKRITLALPSTQEVDVIVNLFKLHFSRKYGSAKGGARLPVLALHALYSITIPEMMRFNAKFLRPLELQSAADSQTGSVGDIEICDDITGDVFEAIEIKHNMPITEALAATIQQKVMSRNISRYYVLTTLNRWEPSPEAMVIFNQIQKMHQCQVIADGVLPTLNYWLRLLTDPAKIFPAYVALIVADKALGHEHRAGWNALVTSVHS